MINEKNKNTPDLFSLINQQIDGAMSNMNCVSIGTIQSFNSSRQTAEISINYKRKIGSENKDYPLLLDCPVFVLSGGQSYLTLPVAKGDTCVVLFCDRDIDTWFSSGQVTTPNTDRIHDLSDAIAFVGIRSTINFLSDYNTIKASLRDITGERLSQSGDTKTSLRTANHSGWLMMNGATIGNDSSGATYQGEEYEELFDILKMAYPNAGTEDFDSNDTVIIPDMRGRGAVGADNMGGSQANVLTSSNTPNRNVLGGNIGEERHTLSVAELATHNHVIKSCNGTPGGYSYLTANYINAAYTQALSTDDKGSSTPHNNVPPGKIMYWFVKI